MIISTPKEKFVYRKEIYRIGDTVTVNGDGIYAGILGEICEIRTGKDKQTDNENPEIYCKFYPPILKAGIEELEKKYSELCKEEKKLEDIPLDSVIMSPDMLSLHDRTENSEKIYLLTEEWANDGNGGVNTFAFTDISSAKAFLNYYLSYEKSDGLLSRWQYKPNFLSEETDVSYSGWIDGEYAESYFSLKIEEREITPAPEFIRKIGERYIENCRYEDFYSQVCEWDEAEKLEPEQWERFISDKRIPERIKNNLSDGCQSEYWKAVSETAHTLLKEYLSENREKQNEAYSKPFGILRGV